MLIHYQVEVPRVWEVNTCDGSNALKQCGYDLLLGCGVLLATSQCGTIPIASSSGHCVCPPIS